MPDGKNFKGTLTLPHTHTLANDPTVMRSENVNRVVDVFLACDDGGKSWFGLGRMFECCPFPNKSSVTEREKAALHGVLRSAVCSDSVLKFHYCDLVDCLRLE